MVCVPCKAWSREREPDPVLPYDEILIFMNVQGVGNVQVPAAIRNEAAYLSITDVFDFLKIKNTLSAEVEAVTGFFISPQAPFLIDRVHNRIDYQGKRFDLPADAFISSATSLYLRSDYFGRVFGLTCTFNFRSLSVVLSTSMELPVLREIRQAAMRSNLNKLKGEERADTILQRSYLLFKLGMADWAFVHSRDMQQPVKDTRVNLALGGVLAGGETNVLLNYQHQQPFNERQQFYQWRFVDNDQRALRQVIAGKINTTSVASIYSPVAGIQFTNAPSFYRRSFGTYTLTYFTEADWIAELYVNNTLVDYSKATATGLAHFQVPLVYGNSLVKIRFYSPWGEERTSEQNIQIPFNFLPYHAFEYTGSAGIVEDSINSRFARINGNYGLSTRLTVGAGIEYLSSIRKANMIPFVNASFRASANLLLAGEYAYGVRSKWVGSYHLPSDLQVELNYTRYKKGQSAINNNFTEERKLILSYPFRGKRFTLFSRLSAYQVILPRAKYTTTEALLSGVWRGINTNLTSYLITTDQEDPIVYSQLSMAFRLPGKLLLTPQAQYEYSAHQLMSVKTELGKYIGARGYVNAFLENNYRLGYKSVGVALRYDLSFAITGFSITRTNKHSTALVQSASGSLLYNTATQKLLASNRSSVAKGAIYLQAFLDLNANGQRDADEPRVKGISININGGRLRYNKADTSIMITDLEAYASYTVKINEGFENVAWHVKNKIISVVIDPNQCKQVGIPVTVDGEVAGSVFLLTDSTEQPLSRVLVDVYRADFTLAAQVITEADGSFNVTALAPGAYTAQVNAKQMEKLHMQSMPWSLPFTITASKEGDFIEGLRFTVRQRAADRQP
ncbi:MAG TPA: carboxypeptidase-like regulatory domain-containing protein [Chitinophagaceae bacterium]|nr:carboxypeptidase-like regulatory domain-containing protein [Chitinophagaceae bacterium]